MAKVSDNNFLTIEGWMRTQLSLSGNELLAYAVIYQFSQGKAGRYIGGLPYLADWCGCHIDTARRALRNLEDRGLITALRGEVNGVPYCNYIACEGSPQNTGVSPQNAADSPANYGDLPGEMRDKTITGLQENYKPSGYNSAGARFVPPTLDEVAAYCRERCNHIDAQQFIDHYVSNGWKVGGNPMKDWRAAVRTWEARRRNDAPASRPRPRYESPEEHNLRVLANMQGRDGRLHTFGPEEQ